MRFSKYFVISFLLFSTSSFAKIRCDLIKNLEHPSLTTNAKFWEEYSHLSSNNKLSDRTLEDLFKKHGAEVPKVAEVAAPALKTPMAFTTTKRVDKEVFNLTKSLRKNYEEFLSIMSDRSGIQKLYENPGKWRMEKLVGQGDKYTVRLSGDVRVLFKLEKNELSILEVDAARVHAL